MWDSNAPLQLLKSMPRKLSKENLETIQMVIDADKYKNSLVSGFDLCGMYAPFCRGCQRTSIYPCAIAYLNMMKAAGLDVEIDAQPIMGGTNRGFEPQQPVVEQQPVAEQKTEELPEEEIAVTAYNNEEETVVEETAEQLQPEEQYSAVPETPVFEEQIAEEEQNTEVEEQITEEVQPVSEIPSQPVKRKIRIAVARKKI